MEGQASKHAKELMQALRSYLLLLPKALQW
jgi:hypothetical protein